MRRRSRRPILSGAPPNFLLLQQKTACIAAGRFTIRPFTKPLPNRRQPCESVP
jgi:hypothetical protein